MSINASWWRMLLAVRDFAKIEPGDVIALGAQDVMFTHKQAVGLFKQMSAAYQEIPSEERTFSLSRNQRQFVDSDKHFMTAKDLFRMAGDKSLDTLDAFGNDKPDLLWDLCKPIPPEWHQKYDLLFDIGTMEHTCNMFQALENAANLVKVGGRIILYLPLFSPINTCMYHPNPPFYYDILAGNGFADFGAWINWVTPDPFNDIPTEWRSFYYNDNVSIYREGHFTVMLFMARKTEHVGTFKPVLQNFYKEWHADQPLLQQDGELIRQMFYL